MDYFPIYTSLLNSVKVTKLSVNEMVELATEINNLDLDGKKKVMYLILYYNKDIDQGDIDSDIIPYKGDINELKWSIFNFPDKLKCILRQFSKMHIEQSKIDQEKTLFNKMKF